METLADRIDWVLKSSRVTNASSWCEKAHLARTYLATYLSRARQGTPSDMGVRVLQSLADAASVNFTWLATGCGSPDEPGQSLPPNLRAVVDRQTQPVYPTAIIRQAVLARELLGEPDLPEHLWDAYLEGLRREIRRIGLELAATRLEGRGIPR